MKVVLDHLTKKFPSRTRKGDTVTAVNDFCFEVPDGSLIGLLGPSGCGKSTALNLICGLEKPTSGRIFFGDDDVTNLPPENRGVGLVFQNYALYPHLTVRQNILFPLQNLKGKDRLSKAEMLKKADEAAKLVQIEQLMDRKPSEMSGGQQQRVAMKAGVVQQIGRPQEVYDDPANLFVAKFLGTPPINVFEGRVAGGKLFLGEDEVLRVAGVDDQPVWAGVRPEGFIPQEAGPLCCRLAGVEVMGRDTSVVSSHPAAESASIRSIITAEHRIDKDAETVRFAFKPNKVFLFRRDSEERIPFEAV